MYFYLQRKQNLPGNHPFIFVDYQKVSSFHFEKFRSAFNTTVDVKLQQWAEKELPRLCVAIGQRVLLDEFQNLIAREQQSRSYDPITNELKREVVEACRTRHQWDSKALDSLVNSSHFLRHSLFPFY